ncbi:MAG: arginine--tRNA ligase [Bacteroidales bacterium]|nr:arginine--tRNA ligase [Bacteroidales bacterium]
MTIDANSIQRTRKDIEGDFTVVVFPYVKMARKSPAAVAQEIGEVLAPKLNCNFNVVNGFLNLTFFSEYWLNFLEINKKNLVYGYHQRQNDDPILIEYSSPNTNKPLHLGHIRNNLLGSSVAKILEACGKTVIKVNLVNDRGIHICKSMLAWKKWGGGETPETSGMKGDHLVGKYYVEFDKHYKEEIKTLTANGMSEDEAAKKAPSLLEAQDMLRRWETGDSEVVNLWKQMNDWVYKGFDETYKRLGIEFNKTYYESNTYLLGKALVQEGLEKKSFFKKEDQSVWVSLVDEGLDEKLLLRGDGTSVYMTQDLGTAQLRYEEFHPQKMIYVVGNEQNYHFDVLKLVLSKKLNRPFGDKIFHLSYGMVELPCGKMKSREGTVVDADDLMDEMIAQAKDSTEQLGKSDVNDGETDLYSLIGLGALKYFILKVDPKKNMLFNPQESIDFNGNTAPFIQYTHARIKSLLRKAESQNISLEESVFPSVELSKSEIELIKKLYEFPQVVLNAGDTFSPALIANYAFDLAKDFNRFYQETPIFKEEDNSLKIIRLQLSQLIAISLRNAMALLGIGVPEKM